MRPVLFHLPEWLPGPLSDLPIPSYGVLMAVGAVLGCLVFGALVRASGKDGGKAFEILLETVLVAILGSKVIGVLFQDPQAGISFWELFVKTGGVWYVGFLCGVGWMTFRARSLEMTTLQVLDHAACAVPAGHALGRLGCFLAGCCFGSRCELPWAVTYTDPQAAARAGTPLNEPLHPVQLYEMGSELLLAGFLSWWLLKKSRFHGQTGFLYLACYAVLRFLYELVRADHRGAFGPVSTSQLIALVILAISVPVLVVGARRGYLLPGDRPGS